MISFNNQLKNLTFLYILGYILLFVYLKIKIIFTIFYITIFIINIIILKYINKKYFNNPVNRVETENIEEIENIDDSEDNPILGIVDNPIIEENNPSIDKEGNYNNYIDIKSFSPNSNNLISDECCICLETMVDYNENKLSILQCQHIFHTNCINLWIKQDNNLSCPLCNNYFIK